MALFYSIMPFNTVHVALIVKGDRNGTAFCRVIANSKGGGADAWVTAYESTATWSSNWPSFTTDLGGVTALPMGQWRNPNNAGQAVDGDAVAGSTLAAGTVRDVTLLLRGSGYYTDTVPVVFTGGGGSGAEAYGVVVDGAVVDYVVSAPGSGYTSNPTVTAVNPNLNKLYQITVTDAGSGYDVPPTIQITGGGGSGATAVAVMNGQSLASITLVAAGSGYTSTPTVTVVGGFSGTMATATAIRCRSSTATAVLSRAFATLSVTSSGATYTDTPDVRVSGNPSAGTGMTASVTIAAKVITGVTLLTPGSQYPTGAVADFVGGNMSVSVVPEAINDTYTTTYKFRRIGAPVPLKVLWDVRNQVTNAVISTNSLTIATSDADNYSADYTMTGIVGATYIMTNFRIEVPL